MLCRLSLALVFALALAAPSLADRGTPIHSSHSRCWCNQAKWEALGHGDTRVPSWNANRIYYARVPGQTKGWSRHLSPADRKSLKQLNFSRYGALALFLTPRETSSVIAVERVPHGLAAVVVQEPAPALPPPPPPGGPITTIGHIVFPKYLLVAVGKGSLPSPVKRLYITEIGTPEHVLP
jgi:hypothetical protein